MKQGKSQRDVRDYQPPQGPSNVDDPCGPGLHGNLYPQGTQGPTACKGSERGKVGLGGDKAKSGSQR